MTEKKSTVTVLCDVPNGLELRLQRRVEGPLGVATFVPTDDPPVTLPGPKVAAHGFVAGAVESAVDEAFFRAWLEQNKDAPFVKNGMVRIAEPAKG